MVGREGEGRPFVTIGVTTYNRHDLLRQTLDSILAQTFADFQVIVGNDYTEEVLTGEMIGITDPRVRFVNHPENLREVGNMNALLGMATGRYFTWLFDDDLYEPNFLQTAYDCLFKSGFPSAFFSSFRMLPLEDEFLPRQISSPEMRSFTGRDFLSSYSARQPEIVSTCGLFDTDVLRTVVGGVEELCPSAIGVYCEYLFLVRCGLLDRIVYVDAPFVLFRIHAGSWSENPSELDKYIEAGSQLIRRSGEVLRHPSLVDSFVPILLIICQQHLITVAHRCAKLEIARNKTGPLAACRAMSRYRKEAFNAEKIFTAEAGESGFTARFAFAKINMESYRVIAINLLSDFYARLKRRWGYLGKEKEGAPHDSL